MSICFKRAHQCGGFFGRGELGRSFELDILQLGQEVVGEGQLQSSGVLLVLAEASSQLGFAASVLELNLEFGGLGVDGLHGGRVRRGLVRLSVGGEGEASVLRVELDVQVEVNAIGLQVEVEVSGSCQWIKVIDWRDVKPYKKGYAHQKDMS